MCQLTRNKQADWLLCVSQWLHLQESASEGSPSVEMSIIKWDVQEKGLGSNWQLRRSFGQDGTGIYLKQGETCSF